MKIIRTLAIAALAISTSIFSFGAPPSQRVAPALPLRTSEDFAAVKTGDKLALVCKECDTISVYTATSPEEAMEYCKEGAEITCPSCKKTFKVVRRGPRSKSTTSTEMRIMNEHGKECVFVAKLPE